MPVRSDALFPSEVHFLDDFDCISSDDLLSGGSFPSDDIWKKFEFCELPLSEFTQTSSSSTLDGEDLELNAVLEWSLDATSCLISKDLSEIRHHDCMWAGHCGSKEHKSESVKDSRPLLNQITPATTTAPKRPVIPVTTTNSRSVLLSRNPPVGARPDSPPSSDDDDHPKFKHEVTLFDQTAENKTLQFLNDAISECDFDDDSDLCDYFEDSDVFAAGETRDATPRSYPGESDHSYHKGKGAQLRTDHLGVQTPSDSEEEIDVVSVGEKQLTTGRNCSTVLPTNPSIRDRQKLQRTVASAISNKREYVPTQHSTGGIKTRLPLRIPNNNVTTAERERSSGSIKKRSANGDGRRGVKRGRHRYQKPSPGTSPAKKRSYGNSSDSETECSEKRSLHNNMERQRRVDLRNAFDDLRVLVPEVSGKERAAKVVILREAASYCDQLGNESSNCSRQVSELRRQQERLRARVSQLRRSLAAKR